MPAQFDEPDSETRRPIHSKGYERGMAALFFVAVVAVLIAFIYLAGD
jgi:hypothetical protein